ncbi:MAG: AsmA family protein [Hyphomicrobiales bacterium]|nr:AsmA family protein [Hyphomicrobiales bacterium]
MREFLTYFGLFLVLVLCTALIGPQFVNWDAERDVMARHLTQWLGRPVQLGGPVSLRLLPAPKLRLGALKVGGTAAQSHFVARDVKLDLAVMPLLQGKIELTTASFDHARITLVQNAAGGFDLPLPPSPHMRGVALAALRLNDGMISLLRSDGTPLLALDRLNVTATAASLPGPLHASGTVASPQGTLAFSLDTGAIKGDDMPLSWSSASAGSWPQADFTGVLTFDAGALTARGDSVLHGQLRAKPGGKVLPWAAHMKIAAGLSHVAASNLQLTLGGGAAALHARGAASVNFAPQPRAAVSLVASQLDLDQLIAARPVKPDPALTVATLDPLAWLMPPGVPPSLPLALTVTATTPILNWGADGVRNVSARLQLAPGQPVRLDFAALAPGGSKLDVHGAVDRGVAADFNGDVAASTDDAPALARWLHRLQLAPADALATWLKALPFEAVGWQGPLKLSQVSFASRNAKLRLDRTRLNGAFAYTAAQDGKPARLFADVDAPMLDLDQVPQSPVLGDAALDLDLALRAHAVRVAHFGAGMIDAGDVDFHLTRSHGQLDLKSLKVAHLGGADIVASGNLGAGGGVLQADISASRLVAASQLLARLFPGPLSAALQVRAPFLAPARLHIEAASKGAPGLPVSAQISGTLAATAVTGSVTPGVKGADAHIALKAPDSAAFLRQIGFETLPLQGLGRADVTLDLASDGTGYSVKTTAKVAGGVFDCLCHLVLKPKGLYGGGKVQVQSPDILPLTRALALALPVTEAQMPLNLSASFKRDDDGLAISALKGVADGNDFKGDLHWQAGEQKHGMVGGSLDIGALTFRGLGALVLGTLSPQRSAFTSVQAFGAPFDRLDIAGLHVQTPQFSFDDGATPAAPASFNLSLQHHSLTIDRFVGTLAGGKLGGKLTISRHGTQASATGTARLAGGRVDVPGLKALVDGTINIATTGSSRAGLLKALAGEGSVTLHEAEVPRADPQALAATLQALGDGARHIGAGHVGALLQAGLDKGAFKLGDQPLVATLSGGVLDLRPAGAAARLHITLDLAQSTLKETLSLPPAPAPALWSGPPPQIGLSFSGPVAAPQRQIEMGGLLDGLATRAIAVQKAKIAAFKADVQERAMFERRLRGWRKMERDAAFEKKFEAERAAAAEARKAAEASAAQKALLAAKKIMTPAKSVAPAPLVIKPLAPLHFQGAPAKPVPPPLMLVPPAGTAPAH